MKPINLYFYSPSPEQDYDTVSVGTNFSSTLFINTAPLFLDAYVQRSDTDFYKRLNWSKIVLIERTQEELIDDINKYNIDVVCFSLYFWNNENILKISKELKSKLNRDVLILAGGPSVGVVRDSEYNYKNPDFDYTIYAQGEKPFYDILKHKFDNAPLTVLSTKNCSWLEKKKLKRADYEFYRLTGSSPYIDSQHILRQIVADKEYTDRIFSLPYETTKGCPYNCSFCDWTSGLSHKVAKRKFNYSLEIDLFGELGILYLYLSDANFGMHHEDFEVINALVNYNNSQTTKIKILSTNFSKTKKRQVYDLVKIMLRNNLLITFKVSIQDMHQNILDNIERPDIPWPDQLTYINEIKTEFPSILPTVEIIQGLPGQTRESWNTTIAELARNNLNALIFKFIIISNSPASYDTSWRERMKIKTDYVKLEYGKMTEMVTSSYSYDLNDHIYFSVIAEVYNQVSTISSDMRHILYPEIHDILTCNADFESFMQGITQYAYDVPMVIEETRKYFWLTINKNLHNFSKPVLRLMTLHFKTNPQLRKHIYA